MFPFSNVNPKLMFFFFYLQDDIDTMSNHGRPSLGSFYGGGGLGAGGAGGGFGGLIGGHTSTLENLQSNLKQREGEVYHLNWEMNRLQTQRNTLANEISEMTGQMEEVRFRLSFLNVFNINWKSFSSVVIKVCPTRGCSRAI